MGNEVVRTALVEANQKSTTRPIVRQAIRTRRENVPIELTKVADKCMNRLFIKSNSLLRRDKNKNKIKVACAREMVGFIWESLHLVS